MAVRSDAVVEDLIEQAVEVLRRSGKRMTTSRRVLLRCLFEGHSHRSAEDLASAVRDVAPDVHLATIYRNLEEFERLGVVEHVHLGHGAATYHRSTEHHGHLVCSECGAIVEVPDAAFSALCDDALRRYGFTIEPHHFALVGRCASCSEPAAASSR